MVAKETQAPEPEATTEQESKWAQAKKTLKRGGNARWIPQNKLDFGHTKIRVVEKDPENPFYEAWVHRLQRADGTWKGGRFVCSGDRDTLLEDGLDPENCPACELALEDRQFAPSRRFFITAFDRKNQQENAAQKLPMEVTVFDLSGKIFDKIVTLNENPDYGNVTTYDIAIHKEKTGQRDRDVSYDVLYVPRTEVPLTEEEQKCIEEKFPSMDWFVTPGSHEQYNTIVNQSPGDEQDASEDGDKKFKRGGATPASRKATEEESDGDVEL